ncbi:MerR family transcriptional regulator [Corynebacterium sp. CNJ-954]|nr:MerR family transcriptional regulator [Corynebacterium sp. CNJ-954]
MTLGEEGHETMTAAQPVPIQGTLFDTASPANETIGYRGTTVCQLAGISYRQLDYWTRTNLVSASIASAAGSGSHRLYSFRDVLMIKIIKTLIDAGISLQNVRKAIGHLADRGVADLSSLTLFCDGTTIYECRSADDVIDLLAGGQGVFGLAVPGLMKDLSATITQLDPTATEVATTDELAARRAARAAS